MEVDFFREIKWFFSTQTIYYVVTQGEKFERLCALVGKAVDLCRATPCDARVCTDQYYMHMFHHSRRRSTSAMSCCCPTIIWQRLETLHKKRTLSAVIMLVD